MLDVVVLMKDEKELDYLELYNILKEFLFLLVQEKEV